MSPPAIAAHPALRFITPARGTHYRIPYFPQGIPAGFPSPGGRSPPEGARPGLPRVDQAVVFVLELPHFRREFFAQGRRLGMELLKLCLFLIFEPGTHLDSFPASLRTLLAARSSCSQASLSSNAISPMYTPFSSSLNRAR